MKRIFKNKKIVLACILAFCTIVGCLSVSLLTQAENVVIHSTQDPELQRIEIGDGDPWPSVTEFAQNEITQEGRRLYDITSNAYVLWWDQDDFTYFYKPYAFNYGRKAKLIVETTLNEWNMPMDTASAGIVVRSSTEADAASAMFHVRAMGGQGLVYRANDGADASQNAPFTYAPNLFPIRLKMEIQNCKVKCFYALNNSDSYTELEGAYTFNYTDQVMVGLGIHSTAEDKKGIAEFEGFKVTIEAPEGTKFVEYGSQAGDPSGEEPDKPTVTLPEDLPITKDVLFMETFSDGSMTEGQETVTNHVWDSNNRKLNENIILDEENLNRYLLLDSEDYWYFAGDQKMSDYSVNMDVNFSKESARSEINQFRIYVRHRYSPLVGHFYYYVDFKWDAEKKEGTVQLCKGYHNSNPVNGSYPEGAPENRILSDGGNGLAKTRFDYFVNEQLGKTHDIQVDVIDNKIMVLWDGQQILYGEDKDTSKFFNGFGGIGLHSNMATVTVDNICVRKINDYLGGDYDNEIGGRFDEMTPEYIQSYQDNKWEY